MFLMKHFFSPATNAIMIENVSFPVSLATVDKETNFFNTPMQFIYSTITDKTGVKPTYYSRRIVAKMTQTLVMGSKCSKNYSFGFLLPLVMSGFDLLSMYHFSIPLRSS